MRLTQPAQTQTPRIEPPKETLAVIYSLAQIGAEHSHTVKLLLFDEDDD
jgi:hypothetical protein